MPQSRTVSTTRLTSWRTPVSRSGVFICPCRCLDATILVAVIDQSMGTSTSFCTKIVFPLLSVMDAVRRSHWSSSYGEIPAVEKRREKLNPPWTEDAGTDVTEGCTWASFMESPLLEKMCPAGHSPQSKIRTCASCWQRTGIRVVHLPRILF